MFNYNYQNKLGPLYKLQCRSSFNFGMETFILVDRAFAKVERRDRRIQWENLFAKRANERYIGLSLSKSDNYVKKTVTEKSRCLGIVIRFRFDFSVADNGTAVPQCEACPQFIQLHDSRGARESHLSSMDAHYGESFLNAFSRQTMAVFCA